MNRRQAAQVEQWAAQDAAGNPECLLCGAPTPVFTDPEDEQGEALAAFELCGRCNVSFRELAQALADAEDARTERAALVDQVAGQLELDDAEPAGELGALELGAVLHAFTTGEWDQVPTMVIADAVQLYADGFRAAELQVMRAILQARA